MQQWKADIWLVFITIIWGCTFVLAKDTLALVEPILFVSARFWVAVVVMIPLLVALRRRQNLALWRDGLLAGTFLGTAYIAQTIGLDLTTPGKAAFITGLNAAIVPLFSPFLLRVFPSRATWIGVALATAGLAIMTLSDSLTGQTGDLWVLACAVLFALHIIAVAKFGMKHDPLAFAMTQFFSAAVIATIGTLVFEGVALPPVETYPTLIFFGVVATAFCFAVYTWVQPFTTATHAALIYALEPVAAALFGIIVMGEGLTGREWVGGAIMLLGVIVAELGGRFGSQPIETASPVPS
jgi:drug/metabolite transporter (DMT)-like permease